MQQQPENELVEILAWVDTTLGVRLVPQNGRFGYALRRDGRPVATSRPEYRSRASALLAGLRASLSTMLESAFEAEGEILEALADGGLFLVPTDPEGSTWAYRWPEEGLSGAGYPSAGGAATAALLALRAGEQRRPYQLADAA